MKLDSIHSRILEQARGAEAGGAEAPQRHRYFFGCRCAALPAHGARSRLSVPGNECAGRSPLF